MVELAVLQSRFRLVGPSELLEQIASLWCSAHALDSAATGHNLAIEPTGTGFLVDLDGNRWPAATPIDTLCLTASVINQACLTDVRVPAFHAAVLSNGNHAVAVPGSSGAGKTTLAAAALLSGLQYVSDEALIVDGDHTLGYPRPLALSPWALDFLGIDAGPGWADANEVLLAPTRLGVVAADGQHVAHIVIPTRATDFELRPLTRNEAASYLLRLCFNHFRQPARTFETVVQLARHASCWHMRYPDPHTGAAALVRLLG